MVLLQKIPTTFPTDPGTANVSSVRRVHNCRGDCSARGRLGCVSSLVNSIEELCCILVVRPGRNPSLVKVRGVSCGDVSTSAQLRDSVAQKRRITPLEVLYCTARKREMENDQEASR